MKISHSHYFNQLIILLVMVMPFLNCSIDEPSPYVEFNITANTFYGVKIFLDINSDGEDDIEFTGGKSSSPGGYQNENYNINILNPDYRILVKSRRNQFVLMNIFLIHYRQLIRRIVMVMQEL
ncbi:MAG: hypothetical protein IPH61_04500 [Bacteroidetes bacterium]|nr:hypothetical protein [Bacteroidota bacterium]